MLSKSDEEYLQRFTAGLDAYRIVTTDDGGWLCIGLGPKLKQGDDGPFDKGPSEAWTHELRVPAGNARESGEWRQIRRVG